MANFLGFSDEEIENNRKEQIKQEVIKKWNDSGLLDGLENINRTDMAQLLESQTSQLINETQPETESGFETVVFPTVRRVFARTVALDILPLSGVDWNKVDFKPKNKIKKHKL